MCFITLVIYILIINHTTSLLVKFAVKWRKLHGIENSSTIANINPKDKNCSSRLVQIVDIVNHNIPSRIKYKQS